MALVYSDHVLMSTVRIRSSYGRTSWPDRPVSATAQLKTWHILRKLRCCRCLPRRRLVLTASLAALIPVTSIGVVLSFSQTLATDDVIAVDLSGASGYSLVARVHSGTTVFYVWEYTGRV
jgi:hypothetical protein